MVTRLELHPSPELRKRIDRWRGQQDDVPPASVAARRLIEWALDAQERAQTSGAHADVVVPAPQPQPPSDTHPAPRRRSRASRVVLRRDAGSDAEAITPDELAAREAKRKEEKAAQRRLQRQREAAREGTVRRGRKQLEVS
jgi:hypothetical protein